MCWQVLTWCDEPYAGVPRSTLAARLQAGLRLALPDNTPWRLRDAVQSCWAQSPSARPPFRWVGGGGRIRLSTVLQLHFPSLAVPSVLYAALCDPRVLRSDVPAAKLDIAREAYVDPAKCLLSANCSNTMFSSILLLRPEEPRGACLRTSAMTKASQTRLWVYRAAQSADTGQFEKEVRCVLRNVCASF